MKVRILILALFILFGGWRVSAQTFQITAGNTGAPVKMVTTAIATTVTVSQAATTGLVSFNVVDNTQNGLQTLVAAGSSYTFTNPGGFPAGTTLGTIKPTDTGNFVFNVVQSGSPVTPNQKQCPTGQAVNGINADGSLICITVASSGGVSSFATRTGDVVPTTGDYTAAQVTGAEATANKGQANGYAGLNGSSQLTNNTTGNAATATALAANPTNCSAGNYPLGIAANGDVENCTAAAGIPGGSDTQVQFNDANAFGGNAQFTFAKTTGNLNLKQTGATGTPVSLFGVAGAGTGSDPSLFSIIQNNENEWALQLGNQTSGTLAKSSVSAYIPNTYSGDLDNPGTGGGGQASIYFDGAVFLTTQITYKGQYGGSPYPGGSAIFHDGSLFLSATGDIVFSPQLCANFTMSAGRTCGGAVIPGGDDSYDLGSLAGRWKNLFLSATATIKNTSAPASPASGSVKFFADSTDLRFHDKNSAGTVGTTVVANAGATHNFLTSLSAAGVLSRAQPACADISDASTGCSATNLTITVASGTSAMGTSAISSGTCATVVTTAGTGIATTDNIMADFNADPTGVTGYAPSANGMLTIIKYPTSGNVNFKVCNNTASSITPGAITLNWRVVR